MQNDCTHCGTREGSSSLRPQSACRSSHPNYSIPSSSSPRLTHFPFDLLKCATQSGCPQPLALCCHPACTRHTRHPNAPCILIFYQPLDHYSKAPPRFVPSTQLRRG